MDQFGGDVRAILMQFKDKEQAKQDTCCAQHANRTCDRHDAWGEVKGGKGSSRVRDIRPTPAFPFAD